MSRVAAIAIALIVGTAALIAQEPQAIAPVPPLPPPFDEWLAEIRRGVRIEYRPQAFIVSTQ